MAGRPKLFAHLRDLPGSVCLTDFPALVRLLGFSPDLVHSKTFQGMPDAPPRRDRRPFLPRRSARGWWKRTIARVFEAGAADCVVKPFPATELTARVGAAFCARAVAAPFVLATLAIDYEGRRVTVDGRAVALIATEYETLRILPVDAGRVVTSESLLRQAWEAGEPTDTERVRAFVKQLRAKLGDDAARPADIFNERAVGYCMARPDEE